MDTGTGSEKRPGWLHAESLSQGDTLSSPACESGFISRSLRRAFNGLTFDDAVQVYRKATPVEKRVLQPMFMRKARTAIENAAPADRPKKIGCGPL